ncbi:MAG: hypothetical protein KAQ98_09930 [Bacteriovoracaceae bacterium]|nr:hypothetical protein [Bacteriovoracaceae bacterium]
MFMAIATETFKHPSKRNDYRVWYLELNNHGDVVGIGVKSREDLIKNLFEHFRKTGKSNWRVFRKNDDSSTPIEIFDFISQNIHENTHFGDLPSLCEFQETLNALQMNLELRSIA